MVRRIRLRFGRGRRLAGRVLADRRQSQLVGAIQRLIGPGFDMRFDPPSSQLALVIGLTFGENATDMEESG
jgi:hypothetical protein